MAVMLYPDCDEVWKFKTTGMAELMREAANYLEKAEQNGAVVEETKFVEGDHIYIFRITYKKGYTYYGPDSA